MRAVAQVVIDAERQREALERRLAAAEAEIGELRERLDAEQRSRGPRSVPPPDQLIA